MVDLRPYQRDLLDRAEIGLADAESRVMVQLPTGGGKTRIAAALLTYRLRDNYKAVWLTHRKELAEQTCRTLDDVGVNAITDHQWTVGDEAPRLHNGVVILMAQTVGRRTNAGEIWGRYGSSDLLVIDEAHHATAPGWERAINQWPGRVVGLTATPWRLSKSEGFDHLFGKLYCGPKVSQLQAEGWLCKSLVRMPQVKDIIRGGAITSTGDYNESGIELANDDQVMTAGALRFWQTCAAERQTVIYAVSAGHANRLTKVFNDAGIRAAVLLSGTRPEERAKAIKTFDIGTLQVLVNVAVATEGFDLPDASCVVLTRPTMSLALYLQMVGRGLRPKADGGDCLILDLAGNSERHGLPEDDRQWSLFPRGSSSNGNAPGVWCEKCNGVSPAASHYCKYCEAHFGQNCGRCGKWRANRRWILADRCDHQHESVCDLCHLDAHIAANLPESRELRESAIDPILFTLVDEVRRKLLSDHDARQQELGELVTQRDRENSNGDDLDHLFEEHLSSLPAEDQPAGPRAIAMTFNAWEAQRRKELNRWSEELAKLRSSTTIEDTMRRGCYEQLEQAGNRNIFEGLGVGEEAAKIEEVKRERYKYFLLDILLREEVERSRWQSQWDELDILTKWRVKTDTMEDNQRASQLFQQRNQGMDRRLLTMKRQFERHWGAIWADCKQSLERE